ncbi:MAG: hypothetical protein HY903_23000 [Deltaproteobacteria bacterium]|nr:hypothetical protein [Deltaproteobacteria bacterium]
MISRPHESEAKVTAVADTAVFEPVTFIGDHLKRHCGMSFREHNLDDLARAVRRAAAQFTAGDPLRLAALLPGTEGEQALGWLVRELTIGESYFFRIFEQFTTLRRVIPTLHDEKVKAGDPEFRVWSAGCAAGEEAYSLAILLRQSLPRGTPGRVIGTDINPEFLSRAAAGEYSSWSLRGLEEHERAAYFEQTGDNRFLLRADFKTGVSFRYHNLRHDPAVVLVGGALFDVILCRNVLIYFEPDMAAAVALQLAGVLGRGGYLLFGPSDPVPAELEGLERCEDNAGIMFHRPFVAPPVTAATRQRRRPKGAGRASAKAPPPGRRTVVTRPAAVAPEPATPVDAAALRRAEAHLLANRGQLDAAVASVERWLSTAPTSLDASYLLASLERRRGNDGRALELLRQCLYLDPCYVLAHFATAEIHAAAGNRDAARGGFSNTLDLLANLDDEALLPGSDEITAGWLKLVVNGRLRRAETEAKR